MNENVFILVSVWSDLSSEGSFEFGLPRTNGRRREYSVREVGRLISASISTSGRKINLLENNSFGRVLEKIGSRYRVFGQETVLVFLSMNMSSPETTGSVVVGIFFCLQKTYPYFPLENIRKANHEKMINK